MLREWGKELAIFLENIGVDVFYFTTLILIVIVLSHYKDIKQWDKLKWDRKFWIGAMIYGLITLIIINLLRLFGTLDL